MSSFSKKSKAKLETCHIDLQRLMLAVVEHEDCSIIEGSRDEETQERYFDEEKTTLHYPDSKHNAEWPELSDAVDVVPYISGIGQIWPNKKTDSAEDYILKLGIFYMFIGYVKAKADELGIKIRLGADWDGDRNILDQKFHDLPHIELVK